MYGMLSWVTLQYKMLSQKTAWAEDSPWLEQLLGGPYWKYPSAQALGSPPHN